MRGGKTVINGVEYSGRSINIDGKGNLVIDGVKQSLLEEKEITVIVHGDVDSIEQENGEIMIHGSVGDIETVNGILRLLRVLRVMLRQLTVM